MRKQRFALGPAVLVLAAAIAFTVGMSSLAAQGCSLLASAKPPAVIHPVIAVPATAGFDQYGFPRLTPGARLITTAQTLPAHIVAQRKYCVKSGVATSLNEFLDQQGDGGYDCHLGSGAPGIGSAFCTKLSSEHTVMNVILRLKWHVTTSNNQANFRADVSGDADFGSADSQVPHGHVPVAETIAGAYQGSCNFTKPKPMSAPPQRVKLSAPSR